MMPLTLLRPFVKPLVLLLICVALVLTFKFVLKSQQKIGALEQALSEKQQQLEQQASRIKSIQTSVSEQQKSIVELQKVQSDLQSKFEQRQITLKEIFAHDEPSKSWSVQPIPDAVRSMFNTTPTHNRSQIVSSAHPLQ